MIETMVLALAVAAYSPLGDPNLVAWYRFEPGQLTTDSSGNSNTLTNTGVQSNTSEQVEGSGCAYFPGEVMLYRAGAGLSSDWPFTSSGPDQMSLTMWVQVELGPFQDPNPDPPETAIQGWFPVIGNWADYNGAFPWPGGSANCGWTIVYSGYDYRDMNIQVWDQGLQLPNDSICNGNSNNNIVADDGNWYFIVVKINTATNSYYLAQYDDQGTLLHAETDASGFDIQDQGGWNFMIGAGDIWEIHFHEGLGGYWHLTTNGGDSDLEYYAGYMDDVVIFNDVITVEEQEDILEQTFWGGGGAPEPDGIASGKQVIRIGM